eukprot:TRINITY_DN690_c0_g1_i1.p1 TRINITY_DN690_c0_g1~~TRINITY_DN690_c0_g1_i1.p1  ORF type:complete len:336 (+),score=64.59 TRINITY_DN690_c0_g1_i1:53-1060(+)
MNMLRTSLMLALAASATASSPSVTVVGSDTKCLGDDLFVTYTKAPRYCTLIALVPVNTPKQFSYSWIRVRVGQPLSCVGQPDCWGTAPDCPDVSSSYSSQVQFKIHSDSFTPGMYEVRMYDTTNVYLASATVNIVDCSCPEASPSLTYTKVDTVEMMDGWSDCAYNLKHIPIEWTVANSYTCRGPSNVAPGTSYTLRCPGDSPFPCDWFVTHYHCPPCSSNENGGWPGILTTEGWESGSCGPRITTPFQYQTATYRRQLAPGESVVMGPSVKPTKYMTFHMMPGADCESMSAGDCDTGAYCSVVNGKCVSNWCPRRHIPKPGPDPCLSCLGSCNA